MYISSNELNLANDYFTTDLRGSLWEKLSQSEQEGALKLAKLDIQSLLKSEALDVNNSLIQSAIFEQAMFLIEKNQIKLKEVVSQQIDGIGTVTYSIKSDNRSTFESNYSSRALNLLKDFSISSVRLER